MYTQARATPAKKQGGIAMLEALIAICLFSLGILALVGLQAVMSKNVTQAKYRTEASFLANQLIGQMWVDQANLVSYAMTGTACTASGYTNCTKWLTAVGQTLPSGQATVTITGTTVNITLNWTVPGEGIPGKFEIGAMIVS